MKLTIVIVHYKTPQLLQECLHSIYSNNPGFKFEVIIIDNNSQDDSEKIINKQYQKIKWININYNSGFARANNIGIKAAKGEYILLLNPDSYIKDVFLENMLCFYEKMDKDGKLGLLGCRIRSSIDQQLLVGSGLGFPSLKKHIKANPLYIYLTRKFISQNKSYIPENQHYINHEIDFVSGACVMIKKSKIQKNNAYLDEDFFLYFEDIEWSYRIKKAGFINYFNSELEIYHVNSASSVSSNLKFDQIQISEYLYFFKTSGKLFYFSLGCILKFNFYLNKTLLNRKMKIEEIDVIKNQELLFQKYFFKIPKIYKKEVSSGQNYLRYVK